MKLSLDLPTGGVIGDDGLEGRFNLGRLSPDLCASIYAICERGPGGPAR